MLQLDARPSQGRHRGFEALAHRRIHRTGGVVQDIAHAVVPQAGPARRRHGPAPGHGFLRSRSTHHLHADPKVRGASAHRACDGEEVRGRGAARRRRREPSLQRDDAKGGLVGVDAAEARRDAKRSGAVAARGEIAQSRGQGRGAAAAGAARRQRQVPRIVRRAVDVVVALPIVEHERHVGVAEHDRAGGPEATYDLRVGRWAVLGQLLDAAGGRHAGDLEGVLDQDGNALQRPPPVPAPAIRVDPRRLSQGLVGQHVHDRHQLRIVPPDPRKHPLGELARADSPGPHRLSGRESGCEFEPSAASAGGAGSVRSQGTRREGQGRPRGQRRSPGRPDLEAEVRGAGGAGGRSSGFGGLGHGVLLVGRNRRSRPVCFLDLSNALASEKIESHPRWVSSAREKQVRPAPAAAAEGQVG